MSAHRAVARAAAITALLVTGAVIYVIVHMGTSGSAPASTTPKTGTGPAAATPASASAKRHGRACAGGCADGVPRLFTSIPRSWRKQIRRHPNHLLTLTAPSGAKIYIHYTRLQSLSSQVRRFHGSHIARIPRGERLTFRAAFCRHRCTEYLLDAGGVGIAILTRSIRPGALSTAARIARTVR